MRHWYGQNYNKGTHTNKNTCNPPLRMKDGNKKTPSNIPTGAPFFTHWRDVGLIQNNSKYHVF